MSFWYLASPYSHPDDAVKEERYDGVCAAVIDLTKSGHIIYSPIAHWHPIVYNSACGLESGWDTWMQHDKAMIQASKGLFVLCLDGWQSSVGVTAEIVYAKQIDKPVRYWYWNQGQVVELT